MSVPVYCCPVSRGPHADCGWRCSCVFGGHITHQSPPFQAKGFTGAGISCPCVASIPFQARPRPIIGPAPRRIQGSNPYAVRFAKAAFALASGARAPHPDRENPSGEWREHHVSAQHGGQAAIFRSRRGAGQVTDKPCSRSGRENPWPVFWPVWRVRPAPLFRSLQDPPYYMPRGESPPATIPMDIRV